VVVRARKARRGRVVQEEKEEGVAVKRRNRRK